MAYKLHPSYITDISSLGKLDNLWILSSVPMFQDSNYTLLVDNPASMEVIQLDAIRFQERPILTIKDMDGNELYVSQPLLVDDTYGAINNFSADWNTLINRPSLTGWAIKTFTDGSTSDVAEGSNKYYTDARVTTLINTMTLDMGTW